VALTGDGAALPVSVAVCDGDTPQHERCRIQYQTEIGAPNIILTNPDMLHCTLLPEVSQSHLFLILFSLETVIIRTILSTAPSVETYL